MPNALSTFLARRGRKNVHETQLNSVWGDVTITSPTDTAIVWNNKQPRIDVRCVEDQTPDLSEGSTPIEDVEQTPVDPSAPRISHKFGFEGSNHDNESLLSYFSSPIQLPFESPRQPIYGLHQPHTGPSFATSMRTDPYSKSTSSSKGVGSHTNALAIFGMNSPVCGAVSPTVASDEVSNLPFTANRGSLEQKEETSIYIPSRRALSPLEISALARKPKPIDRPPYEPAHTYTINRAQYSSLNAAAVEKVQSQDIAILSPVSEALVVDGNTSDEDGVIVIDGSNLDDNHQQTRPSHQFDHVNLSGYSLQDQQQYLGSLPTPEPSPAPTSVATQIVLPKVNARNLTPPHSAKSFISGKADELSIHPYESSHFTALNLDLQRTHASTNDQASISSRGPSFEQSSRARAQTDLNAAMDSMRVTSPPLGITSKMRVKSPALGTTGRMRMQSPPIATAGDSLQPSRDGCLDANELVWSAVSGGLPISQASTHQRSASLEPPPSPSLLENDATLTPRSTQNTPALVHRRLQSDNAVQCSYIPVPKVAPNQPTPANFSHPLRQQTTPANGDLSSYSKPVARHLVAQPLEPSKQFSEPASTPSIQHNNDVERRPSGGSFYDEVKNDYRMLSLEARIAKAESALAEGAASKASGSDKKGPRLRDLSLSRFRERTGQRQLKEEPAPVFIAQQPQLVPSYEEMWS